MCLVCCLDAGFGVRPAQTLSITPTLLVYVKFESRVRAQAASDLEEKTFGNFDHTFQSRVRAQAASDISGGQEMTEESVVSIPRSGSGRFRPTTEKQPVQNLGFSTPVCGSGPFKPQQFILNYSS